MSTENFQRGLQKRHIYLIALGAAIGTGLFLGSGEAIRMAGPAVLLAYIIAGIAVFFVMRSLGEMAIYKPLSGSFSSYASLYIGPLAGFITGWSYVFEMALVCLADITAFATYMGFWYPDVSPWIWTLGITLIITGLNLMAVKIYGELEFWLSIIKVIAIIVMIVTGCGIIVFGFGSHDDNIVPSFSNLWAFGGFMPEGIRGIVLSFSVVVFAFGGIEVIGLTIIEAKEREISIPKAINTIPIRILLFYVLSLVVIMSLIPWNQIGLSGSPFVLIFKKLGISWAADALNFVVITAAVSAINSDMYGAGRMMHGLARNGHAPKFLEYVSPQGVPIYAVFLMSSILFLGVILNYYFHEGLFFLIAAMATFATVLVWLMILFSQINMRRKMKCTEQNNLMFPVLFWPIGPILTVIFMFFVIAVLGINEDSRSALYVGIAWIIILAICYSLIKLKNRYKESS